ncbi:MAG: hypothetical protein CVT49_00710 [candidate division Zixibacteria bacterium HGW-Zixibacteria-1]|nr:MAG: hypothetical protein CVT49_00710 [candidate division Zixibacteria bacterium HGW-Zixibacteria-1]
MMDDKCIDETAGTLLHAYELGLLSTEEKDRFETHLLSCDYCYAEVKKFMPRGLMLGRAADVKKALQEKLADIGTEPSSRKKLSQYLWPRLPLILKPAFLYFLILVLLVPSYMGLKKITEYEYGKEIKPVQMIYLTPTRTPVKNVFESGKETDGVIFIACPGVDKNNSYILEILTESNLPVLVIDDFDKFDERGTAQLVLPWKLMKNGNYQLIIRESTADSTHLLCRYEFGIQ